MMTFPETIYNNRFIRFIIVGAVSAAVDISSTWGMAHICSSFYIPVTTGFIIGLLCNYVLHTLFTFSSTISVSRQLPRFLAVVVLNYLQTILIVYLAMNHAGLSTVHAKIASLPFVAAAGFLLSRYWVYGTEDSTGECI